MNIEEIEKRATKENAIYLYCPDGDTEEWQLAEDVKILLSTIKSLQAERDKYREGLYQVKYEYDQGMGTDIEVCRAMYRAAQSALKEE